VNDLKDKAKAGLEHLKAGTSGAAQKAGVAVDEGKKVLGEAAKDAKNLAETASIKVKAATTAAVDKAKHAAQDVSEAVKGANRKADAPVEEPKQR
jgi:hypothetical protein